MTEVARARTDLSDDDRSWLTRLLADWQILADLSFADLVLWLPDRTGTGFWAAAHMRPTTGPTAIVDDIVDTFVARGDRQLLDRAVDTGRITRDGDPEWRADVAVRVEAIPVRRDGAIIAVIARNTNLQGVRTPSRLELSYLETATELSQMIAIGDFPHPGERGEHADSPRVGDGFIRIDADGAVDYASPNALSVYRKLGLTGDLTGQVLADVTRSLVPASRRYDEETISAVLGGRVPRDTELGNGGAHIVIRAIPLSLKHAHHGALVLLRDVTQLRRRERELVTKDATIREIHHRVKNNLQTVAALLRLQSRRIDNASGRFALDEAVRRVGAIAVVHEVLSQSHEENVAFDEIADHLATLVADVGAREEPVRISREGSFGLLPSEVATSIAMVLTELLQNAVEHAIPHGRRGAVVVGCERSENQLHLRVSDDGIGWSDAFDLATTTSLGMSIVQTLVGELGGTIDLRNNQAGGAVVELTVPVSSVPS